MDELLELLKKATHVIEEADDFETDFDEDDYQAMLDDTQPDVNVCGMEYPAGRALRELDPIAFRCGYADWTASLSKTDCPTYRSLIAELEDLRDEVEELGYDKVAEELTDALDRMGDE